LVADQGFSGERDLFADFDPWHATCFVFRMNTRSASTIGVVISSILALVTVGCSAPAESDADLLGVASGEGPIEGAGEPDISSGEDALTGSYSVGTPLQTTAYVNHRTGPGTNYSIMQVIPPGTRVVSGSATPKSGWYGVTWNGRTGWVHGDYLKTLSSSSSSSTSSSSSSSGSTTSGSTVAGVTVSATGLDQMRRIVPFADANNSGASRGRCFQYVWNYLWRSRYGYIDQYNDAPDMPSAEARNFAEYMNRNGNAARWGLQRLSLSNPYDAPRGSIVVVAAGSPGTAHPTAGDIAIAAGGGRFINDGPNMGYGGSRQAFINGGGRVLGIYVPR
jgi:uncharacterized protein YgiM (DUF1202 family)